MSQLTAKVHVRMTVPEDAVDDLAGATVVARSLVDRAVVLAPEPVWRCQPEGPALPSDRLQDLLLAHAPGLRFTWVVTAGATSTDLSVKAYVGVDGHVTGTVRWRFRHPEELAMLEHVYTSFWEEPTVEFASLVVGSDFLLRLDEARDAEQPRPPIGWRNWFRGPVTSELSEFVPRWCRVVQHGVHRELVLGDEPFGLEPADAATVRDVLASAGLFEHSS